MGFRRREGEGGGKAATREQLGLCKALLGSACSEGKNFPMFLGIGLADANHDASLDGGGEGDAA